MAKSADPVQAARKAAIKREAKRNRERKEQAQEARTLRQDTSALERQIQRLEARQSTLHPEDQEELKRLQAEVAKVNRIKQEYIRQHPDQRNFVRGYEQDAPASSSATKDNSGASAASSLSSVHSQSTHSAAPNTRARDPRWSIYYDPVFNPYGAPPPGMPYLEKPHSQLVAEGLLDAAKPPPIPEDTADFDDAGSEDDSDDSSIDDDLKDVIMPAGPPPIRLLPDRLQSSAPEPNGAGRGRHHSNSFRPRGQEHGRGGRGRGSGPPHPQGGRHTFQQHHSGGARPIHSPAGLPPRPPAAGVPVRPPMATANASQSQPSPRTSGPPRPPGPPPSVPDGVVISAEPQLRDFKKESTAFVPAAIRKKQQEEKARSKRGLPGRIDAAPISEDMSVSSGASYKDRPDLLKSVQAHLPAKGAGSSEQVGSQSAGGNSSKKEYDQFLNDIGDLL